jgi:hypothetical protein
MTDFDSMLSSALDTIEAAEEKERKAKAAEAKVKADRLKKKINQYELYCSPSTWTTVTSSSGVWMLNHELNAWMYECAPTAGQWLAEDWTDPSEPLIEPDGPSS